MKKSDLSKTRKITPDDLRSAIGNTWFDLTESEDRLVLDTRENGDVGSETPGKPDLIEARRLAAAVKSLFPRHEVNLEVVDEWVVLEVKKNEKSQSLLDQEAREKHAVKLRGEWQSHIESALAESSQRCLGKDAQSGNFVAPFSWSRTVSPGEKSCTTTFKSEYGERHLYRDHQSAIPAFKTPEESRHQFEEFVRSIGGTIKAERIDDPRKKLTYNRPAPNNVIEEVGHVSYDVELPLSPPLQPTPPAKALSRQKSTQNPTRSDSGKTI